MDAQRPAYLRVKEFLRARITEGQWKPGHPVPTEAALVEEFGLSRMTVNRALRELMREGLVTRSRGLGTFVAELERISSTIAIRDIQEEIAERGHVHSVKVVLVRAERATAEVSRALELRPGSRVFHSILVHLENAVPIQYEDRYVNPAAAPDFMAVDLRVTTPAKHLLAVAPLTAASYSVEARLPSSTEAKHLGIRPADPCLVMERRTVSGPNVGSVARFVYPGNVYRFQGVLQT